MSADRCHQAYLVRLWAIHRNGELLWRAVIENIHTRERHAFADLSGLCRFLYAAAASHSTEPPGATGAVDASNHE